MSSVTIRDVAKKAGVGVGTVSRVLNDRNAVSEATRQKVLAAIDALEYTPNLAARRLSRGKMMAIGVIVPYFTNPSVVRRLQGVVSVVTGSGYDLVLFDIEKVEQRADFVRNIPRRQLVDGLLIVSLNPTDEDVEELLQANLPTVLVDANHPELSRVRVDNVFGGYQATRHLLDLGHRRIGYISDFLNDPFNSPVRDRLQGYQQALTEAGIAFCSDYHQQGVHSRQQARLMALDMLQLPDPPTAVFAYSDTQAVGVLEAARELGRRVPQDLSIIGFDNIEAAEYLHLTTVQQGLYDSGAKGCQLLLTEMLDPPASATEILLPTQIVMRQTTAVYDNTTRQV
ncbi:MAG: LacI family DNA-binding transcriptional regulator [Anaerolineales bacterium]|nr:LacI family DNA-binding transcriptional regulator [Anaerolineales bacterium]